MLTEFKALGFRLYFKHKRKKEERYLHEVPAKSWTDRQVWWNHREEDDKELEKMCNNWNLKPRIAGLWEMPKGTCNYKSFWYLMICCILNN